MRHFAATYFNKMSPGAGKQYVYERKTLAIVKLNIHVIRDVCWILLFGAESFVLQVATQKLKD